MANSIPMSKSAPERPIDSSSQDNLGRSGFARRVANSLVDPHSRKATGVVVAITGPWGSGKSSVLNLIQEEIEKKQDANVIVLRFDPWLISSRDELIQQFLIQLTLSLRAKETRSEKVSRVLKTLPDYARKVLPIASDVATIVTVNPWAHLFSPAVKLFNIFFKEKGGLQESKKRVHQALLESELSIVVLVDEVDRVSDEEIRSLAQLVRSIADFPGISYCLAYDRDRVAEALGNGVKERGRSFLEKIVQYSFGLPIMFPDEMRLLLSAELSALDDQYDSQTLLSSPWYKVVEDILMGGVLENPRDVKRLIGTFRVYLGAVGDEVLLADLVAFAALQSKFPHIVDEIRKRPELYVEDPLDTLAYFERESLSKLEKPEILTSLFGSGDSHKIALPLLAWLFPLFSDDDADQDHRSDRLSISNRRPLLTLLRMGLIPGHRSRTEVVELIRSPETLRTTLGAIEDRQKLSQLMQQLYEVIPSIATSPDTQFWYVLADFVEPKGNQWQAPLGIEQTIVDDVSTMLRRFGSRGSTEQKLVDEIVENLIARNQHNLVLHVLWHLFAAYGLFGGTPDPKKWKLLSKSRVEQIGLELAAEFRQRFVNDKRWARTLGSVYPLLLIWLIGQWDDLCSSQLRAALDESAAVDWLSFLFFGDSNSVGLDVVEKMVGVEYLAIKVRDRLRVRDSLRSERYQEALKKAARRLQVSSPEIAAEQDQEADE